MSRPLLPTGQSSRCGFLKKVPAWCRDSQVADEYSHGDGGDGDGARGGGCVDGTGGVYGGGGKAGAMQPSQVEHCCVWGGRTRRSAGCEGGVSHVCGFLLSGGSWVRRAASLTSDFHEHLVVQSFVWLSHQCSQRGPIGATRAVHSSQVLQTPADQKHLYSQLVVWLSHHPPQPSSKGASALSSAAVGPLWVCARRAQQGECEPLGRLLDADTQRLRECEGG